MQLDLFQHVATDRQRRVDTKRRHRTTDPDTSRAAAEYVTRTGSAGRQQSDVLSALSRHDGSTCYELADKSGLPYEVIHKRMAELERAERVQRRGKRRGPSGRQCYVWWFVSCWLLMCSLGCSALPKATRSIEAKAKVDQVDWTGREGAGSFEVVAAVSWEPEVKP